MREPPAVGGGGDGDGGGAVTDMPTEMAAPAPAAGGQRLRFADETSQERPLAEVCEYELAEGEKRGTRKPRQRGKKGGGLSHDQRAARRA